MSNWALLNQCRLTGERYGKWSSTPEYGSNGAFRLYLDYEYLKAIASDGEGWKHVSVSRYGSNLPPTWSQMCQAKDLFWEPEDWVVQYHPAQSQYINNHPGVLHLWQPLTEKLPTPPSIMVGLKELNL